MKFSEDLENWMSLLPEDIRGVPLIFLSIPGSHDSGSYGITRKNKLAPDAEPIVKKVYKFIPCIVRRWAKTQKFSIEEQLINGIRYFDLRVAQNNNDQKQYFVHGLYCEEVVEPFKEILAFLEDHPREFIILDFQHFYDLSPENHNQLINCVMSFFEPKLVRMDSTSDLRQISLSNAFENGQQILIIYRNPSTTSSAFFSSCHFPTPWPNATNIRDLKDYLERRIQYRTCQQGYISQCLLTPDANFIIPRFYSSLRKACAKKVDKELMSWIQSQQPGPFGEDEEPKSNIFLADFTDLCDNSFTKNVIDLNMKLKGDESCSDTK